MAAGSGPVSVAAVDWCRSRSAPSSVHEQVNAFTVLLREEALEQAQEVDRTRPDLPLRGCRSR